MSSSGSTVVQVVHFDDRRRVPTRPKHVAHCFELSIGCLSIFERPASKETEPSEPDEETFSTQLKAHPITLLEPNASPFWMASRRVVCVQTLLDLPITAPARYRNAAG